MASAVGKTDVGYDKSRWQRIGDATRAVEMHTETLTRLRRQRTVGSQTSDGEALRRLLALHGGTE